MNLSIVHQTQFTINKAISKYVIYNNKLHSFYEILDRKREEIRFIVWDCGIVVYAMKFSLLWTQKRMYYHLPYVLLTKRDKAHYICGILYYL